MLLKKRRRRALVTTVTELRLIAAAANMGLSAVEMSLEGKSATLTLSKDVDNQVLTDAVTQAGYEVVSVQ